MALHGIEKRLEALVEGAFARAFHSELRPIELGRRMLREVDAETTLGVRGERVAPNHVVITVAVEDFDRFAPFADPLKSELADSLEEHARNEQLELKGPAMVDLVVGKRLRSGQFQVTTAIKVASRRAVPKGWLQLGDGPAVAVSVDDPVTIGRLPECDLVIRDTNVSRQHAEVRVDNGVVRVVDLRSMNGTRVNGHGVPVDEFGVPLQDGDLIQVGPGSIRFSVGRVKG